MNDAEIIKTLTPLVDDAKTLQSQLSPQRENFIKLYNAEPYGNERDGWSKTVAPVVFDTVEWIKPYLYEIFTGDFFSFTGRDDEGAQQLKEYIRFKLFTEGDTEDEIDDFLHYALTTFYGAFKVTHVEEFHYETRPLGDLQQHQFDALNNLDGDGVHIAKYDEVEKYDPYKMRHFTAYENVKAVQKVIDYIGPKVECVPPYELYFSSGYAKLKDCPLVAHVVRRSLDYVRRKEKEGTYKKGSAEAVEKKLLAKISEDETEEEITAQNDVDGIDAQEIVNYPDDINIANSEVLIWECYVKLDIDNDGLLEDAIVTVCENVVLQDPVENEYITPPFELGHVFRQPHNVLGKPFPDVMGGWQKVMTNMQRSIQDAAIISTKRGWVTDNPSTQDALRNWVPGDTALVDKIGSLDTIDFGSPSQFLFKAYEQISADKDKNSGVNEAMQGMDRDAMNHTASGMKMKLNASQSRQRLYARRLSRTFRNVLRRCIDILRVHPPEDDINAVGADVQIDSIDLNGKYFVKIDVGTGPQENMSKAQVLDGHLQFLVKAGIQMGVADQTHVIKTIDRKSNLLDMNMHDLVYSEEEYARKQPAPPMGGPQQGPGGPPRPAPRPQPGGPR